MLALAGTLAVHLIALTIGDALVVIHPPRVKEPAPHIDLVEIEPPPVLKEPPPPPPPEAAPEPAPEAPKPVAQPQVARTVPARRAAPVSETPPPPEAPTVPAEPSDPGGAEVVHMDNIAPAATGVAVATGKRSTGRIGRGGTGGGTGSGAGSGAGEAPKPVSIATIKTRAMPKRDYGDIREYPAEARALGIEGDIRVRLIVDEQGRVKSRVLLNKLGHGLDELALARTAEFEFEPARDTNDQPVTSVVIWTFHMVMPK